MYLKIGHNIKRLRREQDITQEKLADYLNISYQAVSRWENGMSYPDITLLPSLANFFGVSADELLGIETKVGKDKLSEYEKEYGEYQRQGKIYDSIELCRRVLDEYPRNYEWMSFLAHNLVCYNSTEEQDQYSKEHHFIEEAILLSERILEDCTVESIRQSAIQILCYNYSKIGKKDKALELAYQMPILALSQEFLLSQIKDGEDKVKQEQENLLQMIGHCANSLTDLSFNRDLGKDLSLEDKIRFVEASNKLYQTVLSDSNALFYHCRFAWNYRRLAELECGIGDRKKAMDYLLLAEKSAAEYDNCTQEQNYTSPFINRVKYNPNNAVKNWEGSERSMLYYRTTEGVFDSMRDMSEFVELQKRLLI